MSMKTMSVPRTLESQEEVGHVDPFSCFGDESDSDDEGTTVDEHPTDPTEPTATNSSDHNLEKGRRLLRENTLRKQNSLSHHLPILSPDFQVFDDTARGRGMGVRALRPFAEGEEIMREGAAMRVPGRLHASGREEAEAAFVRIVGDAFGALSVETAGAFMELSACEKYLGAGADGDGGKTPAGIYMTNSFELDGDDSALYLTISRINHSCRPNVSHIWRPDLQKTLILATRSITEGEEICTSYGPSECLDTSGRRSFLRDKYSFECLCRMCVEGNDFGGDDRMVELNSVLADISFLAASDDSEAAIRAVERGLSLMDEQGLGGGVFVKQILHNGYQISLMGLKDGELARSYLERELLEIIKSEGAGGYKAIDAKRLLDELDFNICKQGQ